VWYTAAYASSKAAMVASRLSNTGRPSRLASFQNCVATQRPLSSKASGLAFSVPT
jgi:hypothetical protein